MMDQLIQQEKSKMQVQKPNYSNLTLLYSYVFGDAYFNDRKAREDSGKTLWSGFKKYQHQLKVYEQYKSKEEIVKSPEFQMKMNEVTKELRSAEGRLKDLKLQLDKLVNPEEEIAETKAELMQLKILKNSSQINLQNDIDFTNKRIANLREKLTVKGQEEAAGKILTDLATTEQQFLQKNDDVQKIERLKQVFKYNTDILISYLKFNNKEEVAVAIFGKDEVAKIQKNLFQLQDQEIIKCFDAMENKFRFFSNDPKTQDNARAEYIKLYKLYYLYDYCYNNYYNKYPNVVIGTIAYNTLVCFRDNTKKERNDRHQKTQTLVQGEDAVYKTISKLSDYITNHYPANQDLFKAINQICLPNHGDKVTLDFWRNLFADVKDSKELIKTFAISDLIEIGNAHPQIIIDNGDAIWQSEEKTRDLIKQLDHKPPKDLKDAVQKAIRLIFPMWQKNPAIAEMFFKYDLMKNGALSQYEYFNARSNFSKALELDAKRKKKQVVGPDDNLPDVQIDGAKCQYTSSDGLKKDCAGYFLVKLPVDDPIVYMLGQVVDNCQYIGGLGEHYIEPGVVKKDSGYYVLLKAYNKDAKLEDIYNSKERKINYDKCEIVGEGLTYLGKGGNLCFDSWENLRFQPYDNINKAYGPLRDDAIIVPILEEFSRQIVKKGGIERVTIGVSTGCKTPATYKQKERVVSEIRREPEIIEFPDSKGQSLIYQCKELSELKAQLKARLIEELKIINPENTIESNQGKVDLLTSLFNRTESIESFLKLDRNLMQKILSNKYADSLIHVQNSCYDIHPDFYQALLNMDDWILYSIIPSPLVQKGFYKPSDFLGLSPEKITLLLSYEAEDAVSNGYCTPQELIALTENELKSLKFSLYNEICKNQNAKYSDLSEFNQDELRFLFTYKISEYKGLKDIREIIARLSNTEGNNILIDNSDKALLAKALKKFDAELSEKDALKLANEPLNKIKLLVSPLATNLYTLIRSSNIHKWHNTIAIFMDFTEERINLLFSDKAIELYKVIKNKYYEVPLKLMACSVELIKLLTSEKVIDRCKSPAGNFYWALHDNKDESFIRLLVSDQAFEISQNFNFSLMVFRRYSEDTVRSLISDKIMKFYGKQSLERLLKFDDEFIELVSVLVSDKVVDLFMAQKQNPDMLFQYNPDTIKSLTSDNAINLYNTTNLRLHELCQYDQYKIKALLSQDSVDACNKGYYTIHELMKYNTTTIELLTSKSTIELHKSGVIDLNSIKQYPGSRIEVLLSHNARTMYRKNVCTLEQLSSYNDKKIELLISYDAITLYKDGYNPQILLNIDNIQELEEAIKDGIIRRKSSLLSDLIPYKGQVIYRNLYEEVSDIIAGLDKKSFIQVFITNNTESISPLFKAAYQEQYDILKLIINEAKDMDNYNSSKSLEQVRQSVMYKLLTCKINNTITGTRDDFRQTVDENLYQMLKRCGKTESMDFIANLLKDEAILLKECFPHQSTKTMSKSIKPQDIKEIKDSKNKGFNIH